MSGINSGNPVSSFWGYFTSVAETPVEVANECTGLDKTWNFYHNGTLGCPTEEQIRKVAATPADPMTSIVSAVAKWFKSSSPEAAVKSEVAATQFIEIATPSVVETTVASVAAEVSAEPAAQEIASSAPSLLSKVEEGFTTSFTTDAAIATVSSALTSYLVLNTEKGKGFVGARNETTIKVAIVLGSACGVAVTRALLSGTGAYEAAVSAGYNTLGIVGFETAVSVTKAVKAKVFG